MANAQVNPNPLTINTFPSNAGTSVTSGDDLSFIILFPSGTTVSTSDQNRLISLATVSVTSPSGVSATFTKPASGATRDFFRNFTMPNVTTDPTTVVVTVTTPLLGGTVYRGTISYTVTPATITPSTGMLTVTSTALERSSGQNASFRITVPVASGLPNNERTSLRNGATAMVTSPSDLADLEVLNIGVGTGAFSFAAPNVTVETSLVISATTTQATNGVTYIGTITFTISPQTNPSPVITGHTTMRTVNEGDTFTMAGIMVTNEPDTDTVTHGWGVTNAAGTSLTTAMLTDDDKLTVSFTAPPVMANADVVLRLVVSDGFNALVLRAVTVRIINVPDTPMPNRAPSANAGGDRNVLADTTVMLVGSGSDPDGNMLTYQWTISPTRPLTTPTAAQATFTVPVNAAVGTRYTATLTVRDPDGLTGTAMVTLTVTDVIAIPTQNHEAILPETARAIADNLADNIAARISAGRGVWGGVDIRNVGGGSVSATTAEFDGSLTGINIGVDRKFGDKIGGVALSKVSGAFTVTGEADDYEVDALLISPYLAWRSGGLDWWGFAGVGSGETTQGGITEDLSITSLGGGVDGGQIYGVEMRGDVSHSNATGGDTDTSATRIRGTADLVGGDSGTVSHNGHAALRGDFGDGDTGLGVEIGGNVSRVVDRLTLTARAKLLLFHTGDASETGISGDIRYRTAPDGQGASFHLTPTIGDSAKADAAFNFGIPTTHGLVTPFTAITVGNDNVYRMGVNLRTRHGLQLGLTADENQTVLKVGL